MTAQPLSAPVQEPKRIARLRAKVEPALGSVRVNQVILAQRAVSQAWILLSYWILLLQPWRVLVVSDAGIHVYTTSRTTTGRPGTLLGTLPPDYLFGEPKGAFRTVRQIGPERLSIHRAYWGQLRAADADQPRRSWTASQGITAPASAPTGVTVSLDGRWWWDGRAWQPVASPAP